jgi:hypothetical protein
LGVGLLLAGGGGVCGRRGGGRSCGGMPWGSSSASEWRFVRLYVDLLSPDGVAVGRNLPVCGC